MAPENLYYFGGYESWVSANSPQALVVPLSGGEPVLLLRDVDLPLALESTWVSDIRTYNLVRERFAIRLREILEDCGVRSGRIAIEAGSSAVTATLWRDMEAEMAHLDFIDATRLLGDRRLLKSAAEMRCLERAGSYAATGLAALVEGPVAGLTEIGLAARIESALRRAGSDYWAIPTELAGGIRSAGGHATPRERVIEPGELVHAEFAGVCARYHAVAIQTIACGEPGAAARELYAIALASLRAGIAAATPGAEVSAVEEASLVPLRAQGLEHAAMMRFGYGVGIAYPPVWLETLQIAKGFDYRLEPGMVFVLHSCLELPEERLGVIQGGTWAMTESGLRPIAGAGDSDLVVL